MEHSTHFLKREKLQIERTREKLELNFGSIENMNRIPEAIFVVDINKEHIAVAEANKLECAHMLWLTQTQILSLLIFQFLQMMILQNLFQK